MHTEQLLCWSGMTDTEYSTASGSNEVVIVVVVVPTSSDQKIVKNTDFRWPQWVGQGLF